MISEAMHAALIDKLPAFDLQASDELRNRWFEAFAMLASLDTQSRPPRWAFRTPTNRG